MSEVSKNMMIGTKHIQDAVCEDNVKTYKKVLNHLFKFFNLFN